MDAVLKRSRYYVVYDGEWKIQCDGENSEPYTDKRDAVRDAMGLAQLDVRNGRAADVIVQNDDALFRPAWVSNDDSFPPPLVPVG